MHYEEDCIGKLAVADDVLYGINTTRALHNFNITTERTDSLIFQSMIQIKKAAAVVNHRGGTLAEQKAKLIVAACNALLLGQHQDDLVAPAIQGSAGTSVNMNVNEVIAKCAMRMADGVTILPNDDINQCQSTNDTYPTAGKMAMLKALPPLLQNIEKMVAVLLDLADRYANVLKVGRTQLEDAVPTVYGHTFHAYASLFRRDLTRLRTAAEALQQINLGGTAIGTGLNATDYYRTHVVEALNGISGLKLALADDMIDATQNTDTYVAFSGAMKVLAVDLSKFCNDLRLLNSGPQAGFGELRLPAKQAGSSIMPGKVNPVIPEVVNQVAFQVIGQDVTIGMAAEAGQLELNAFEPIMFRDLLQNERFLTQAIDTLVHNCLNGLTVNVEQCEKNVRHSAVSATVLNPYLGYAQTTALVKEALAKQCDIQTLLKEKKILAPDLVDRLFSPEVMTNQIPTTESRFVAERSSLQPR